MVGKRSPPPVPAAVGAELRVQERHVRGVLVKPLVVKGPHRALRERLEERRAFHTTPAAAAERRRPRPRPWDRALVDVHVRARVLLRAGDDEEDVVVVVGQAAARGGVQRVERVAERVVAGDDRRLERWIDELHDEIADLRRWKARRHR